MFGMEFSDNQISRHDASIQIKTVLLFAILDVVRNTVQSHALWKMSFCLEGYSSSHNHGIGKWHYWKILGNETGLGRPLLHPFTSIYPFHILRIIFHPFSKYGTKQNLCFLSALPLLWTPAGVEVPVSEEEPTNGTEDVASPPHRFLAATELRWMGVDS